MELWQVKKCDCKTDGNLSQRMEFNASRITSITFWGFWILDQKGLGHAGPLGF